MEQRKKYLFPDNFWCKSSVLLSHLKEKYNELNTFYNIVTEFAELLVENSEKIIKILDKNKVDAIKTGTSLGRAIGRFYGLIKNFGVFNGLIGNLILKDNSYTLIYSIIKSHTENSLYLKPNLREKTKKFIYPAILD